MKTEILHFYPTSQGSRSGFGQQASVGTLYKEVIAMEISDHRSSGALTLFGTYLGGSADRCDFTLHTPIPRK